MLINISSPADSTASDANVSADKNNLGTGSKAVNQRRSSLSGFIMPMPSFFAHIKAAAGKPDMAVQTPQQDANEQPTQANASSESKGEHGSSGSESGQVQSMSIDLQEVLLLKEQQAARKSKSQQKGKAGKSKKGNKQKETAPVAATKDKSAPVKAADPLLPKPTPPTAARPPSATARKNVTFQPTPAPAATSTNLTSTGSLPPSQWDQVQEEAAAIAREGSFTSGVLKRK